MITFEIKKELASLESDQAKMNYLQSIQQFINKQANLIQEKNSVPFVEIPIDEEPDDENTE